MLFSFQDISVEKGRSLGRFRPFEEPASRAGLMQAALEQKDHVVSEPPRLTHVMGRHDQPCAMVARSAQDRLDFARRAAVGLCGPLRAGIGGSRLGTGAAARGVGGSGQAGGRPVALTGRYTLTGRYVPTAACRPAAAQWQVYAVSGGGPSSRGQTGEGGSGRALSFLGRQPMRQDPTPVCALCFRRTQPGGRTCSASSKNSPTARLCRCSP